MYGINWRKLSIMLKPDDDTGASGGSQTTTTNPVTTTGGRQDNNTLAGGAATGAATNQAATNTNTAGANTQAPKFTDDDMAADRARWEADTARKVADATETAKQEEAIKQGRATEIAATRLETIHTLEAQIARMEPVLNERLDKLTKGWPQSILPRILPGFSGIPSGVLTLIRKFYETTKGAN